MKSLLTLLFLAVTSISFAQNGFTELLALTDSVSNNNNAVLHYMNIDEEMNSKFALIWERSTTDNYTDIFLQEYPDRTTSHKIVGDNEHHFLNPQPLVIFSTEVVFGYFVFYISNIGDDFGIYYSRSINGVIDGPHLVIDLEGDDINLNVNRENQLTWENNGTIYAIFITQANGEISFSDVQIVDENNCQNPKLSVDGDHISWEKIIDGNGIIKYAVKSNVGDFFNEAEIVYDQGNNHSLVAASNMWHQNNEILWINEDENETKFMVKEFGWNDIIHESNPFEYEYSDFAITGHMFLVRSIDESFIACIQQNDTAKIVKAFPYGHYIHQDIEDYFKISEHLEINQNVNINDGPVYGQYNNTGTEYIWEAFVNDHWQLYSRNFSFLLTGSINKEFANQIKLNISPNPVQNQVQVSFELEKSSNLNIKVFNINGTLTEELYSEKTEIGFNNHTFNINSLKSGTYIIQVEIDGKRMVEKIIKL